MNTPNATPAPRISSVRLGGMAASASTTPEWDLSEHDKLVLDLRDARAKLAESERERSTLTALIGEALANADLPHNARAVLSSALPSPVVTP